MLQSHMAQLRKGGTDISRRQAQLFVRKSSLLYIGARALVQSLGIQFRKEVTSTRSPGPFAL